jgi:hypothetical protein
MSGIMNDGEDVAFWAGGNYSAAVETMNKLHSGNKLTDSEWNSLVGFAATHGGKMLIKGYIYALGGVFRGTVYANDGVFNGTVNASDGVFKGRIEAKEGYFLGNTRNVMVDITPENIQDYVESGDGTIESPYRLDFDKTGFCVRFSGRFKKPEDEEKKVVFLQLPYMTKDTPAEPERDKIRATNFNRLLIYNQSEGLDLGIDIMNPDGDGGLTQQLYSWQVFEGSAKLVFTYNGVRCEGLQWEYTVHE